MCYASDFFFPGQRKNGQISRFFEQVAATQTVENQGIFLQSHVAVIAQTIIIIIIIIIVIIIIL